jgi:hypothetical protein
MLSDGSDKVARGEDLKVALDLRIHAGAINDGSGFRVGVHLFDGEGIADDVLREPLKILFLMGLDTLASVNVEAGVLPAQKHPGAFGRQQAFFEEERDGARAEQLLERTDADFGQDEEPAATQKKAVGNECVEMWVKIEVFPEGVDGHDDAGHALGLVQ